MRTPVGEAKVSPPFSFGILMRVFCGYLVREVRRDGPLAKVQEGSRLCEARDGTDHTRGARQLVEHRLDLVARQAVFGEAELSNRRLRQLRCALLADRRREQCSDFVD